MLIWVRNYTKHCIGGTSGNLTILEASCYRLVIPYLKHRAKKYLRALYILILKGTCLSALLCETVLPITPREGIKEKELRHVDWK